MANEITKATSNKAAKSNGATTMQAQIKLMGKEIAKALPSVITPERFTRIVLSAISTNPKLGSCTPNTFLGAMMTAAQLGLEPNTPLGQAYLLPYWNNKNKCYDCQFQLGYKGLIDLAYRSGQVSTIQAHVVHEGDKFTYSFGLEPTLEHVPAVSGRGEPVAVYAVFRTKDGGFGFEVMGWDECLAHGQKYSKSYEKGPWQTNPEEMAKKTVLKRVLKYAPLKSDFVRQVAQDETIKQELMEDMFDAPTTYIESEAVEVDPETGEVIEPGDGEQVTMS